MLGKSGVKVQPSGTRYLILGPFILALVISRREKEK
jgi:hypothetical protein